MTSTIVQGLLADVDGVRAGPGLASRTASSPPSAPTWASRTHVFADSCLIFAGMGDIHIHAREDVTGRETHKETFATAPAAALHGGVVHVADMPNNPAAPVDDASYAAKETPACPPTRFPSSSRSTPASGPARGRSGAKSRTRRTWVRASATCTFPRLKNSTGPWPAYCGRAVSFHCEDPVLLESTRAPQPTRRAGPPSAS